MTEHMSCEQQAANYDIIKIRYFNNGFRNRHVQNPESLVFCVVKKGGSG